MTVEPSPVYGSAKNVMSHADTVQGASVLVPRKEILVHTVNLLLSQDRLQQLIQGPSLVLRILSHLRLLVSQQARHGTRNKRRS